MSRMWIHVRTTSRNSIPAGCSSVSARSEHAERLFVGILARPAQRGGMEPDLLADMDPQAMRTGALGTAADGPGLDGSNRAGDWFGRTACIETSRQARSFNGGCSISVVAGR